METPDTEAKWVGLPEAAGILGISLNSMRSIMSREHGFSPYPPRAKHDAVAAGPKPQHRILRSELTERTSPRGPTTEAPDVV